MPMIGKIYDHVTMYYEERDDATAGKIRRLHDWMNVSVNGISGWVPRPQRFIGDGDNTNSSGWSADNMVDLSWDSLEKWSRKFGMSGHNSRKVKEPPENEIRLHRFCEMPVKYTRTSAA